MLTSGFYLKIAAPLLFAFVLTLPLANRDIFSIFISRLFPVRIILVVLILVSLFFLLSSFFSSSDKKTWLREKAQKVWADSLLKLFLGLWLLRLASIVNSLNLKASLDLLLFYSSIIAVYLIFKYFYEVQSTILGRLFKFHLLVVSLVALFGLLQLVLAFLGIRLPGVLVGSTFVRIPATFYDTNHLPAYLLTAFPVLLILFFYQRSEAIKFFWAILLSVFAVVILFTFSRSGFLSFALIVLMISLVFLKKRYWQKLMLVLGTILTAALVIYLSSQTQLSIIKRLSSVFNLEDKSTIAHGLLIYGSLDLFSQSPLIGWGYGSFSEHFRGSQIGLQHALFDPAIGVRIPAHSLWLETLVETGIVGFALYLWLIISILEKGWQALKKINDPKIFLLQAALISSLVGLMAGGLFYSYNLEFFWFFIFIVLFQSRSILERQVTLAGESILVSSQVEPEKGKWPIKSLIFLISLISLSISLIFSGLGLLPVLPGREGFYADVGKVMRIDWGYGVKDWWVPRFLGQVVGNPPLPFFLNSFWTFLYDYGAGVVRFFPAFFGLLSVIFFFFWQKSRLSLNLAFFSSLVFLAFPGVLINLRFGDLPGYIVFFSTLIIFLSHLIFEKRKSYLLSPLLLILVLFSLISYSLYLLTLLVLFAWFFYPAKIKRAISGWVTPLLLISAGPLFFWVLQIKRVAPNLSLVGILRQDFFNGNFWWLLYFLALPLIVSKFSERVFKMGRTSWLMILLSFALLFSFWSSFRKPARRELSQLTQKRLELNRDGRIPLYSTAPLSEDLYYYAEVPLIKISLPTLREKINSQEHFYAMVEGSTLRNFKENSISNFFVVAVSRELTLIEKPGR